MTVFSHIKTPHGITDRHGGVSTGPYASMNTSFYGPDEKSHVFENIKRAIEVIGIECKKIVATEQVHSDHIIYLDKAFDFSSLQAIDLSGSPLDGYELYIAKGTDGLMTDRNDVVLMTFYADCVPIVLYDEISGIAATVHSGWKGTVQKIGAKAIEMMISKGSKPHDIVVGIGQSAGQCCYEVDEPVIEAFKKAFSSELVERIAIQGANKHYMLDLKLANRLLLTGAGAHDHNFEVSPHCTICGEADFHSHRRTGYPRGSMSTFIQVK